MYKNKIFLISLTFLILFTGPADAKKPFIMLDATLFLNKPDLSIYGFDDVKVISQWELWIKGKNSLENLPRDERIKEVTKRVHKLQPDYVVLNVEHWPIRTTDKKVVSQSLNNYKSVYRMVKTSLPEYKIGFYRLVPNVDYNRANKGKGTPQYLQWQKDNDRMKGLAGMVDVIYPSLYTFTSGREKWKQYATEQISEARRLANGKPVICFLWPRYHNSNKLLGGKFLPRELWRDELELVLELADGFIIWDGKRHQWPENMAWWNETKLFIKENFNKPQSN
ncbi:MAG: hypothetical protein QM500_17205 [Methylococcales bacterium]